MKALTLHTHGCPRASLRDLLLFIMLRTFVDETIVVLVVLSEGQMLYIQHSEVCCSSVWLHISSNDCSFEPAAQIPCNNIVQVVLHLIYLLNLCT